MAMQPMRSSAAVYGAGREFRETRKQSAERTAHVEHPAVRVAHDDREAGCAVEVEHDGL